MARKTSPDVPPVKVPKLPHQPRHRRPGIAIVAVAIVMGGGVLAFHTLQQLDDRSPVLVVTRDVPIGQQLTKNDLAVAMVNADDHVATIRGSQLARVVGTRAALDLKQGMLLVRQAITDQMSPVPGQELVAVALKPSRLPARGLRPGDDIRVVPAPQTSAKAPKVTARVDQVRTADTDGLVVVDLLVNAADGDRLAEACAEGQVMLVLTSKGT